MLMVAAAAGVVGASRCTVAVGLDGSHRDYREQVVEKKCKPILCFMVLKLLLEWVVIRSSCTAALLRKRLPDASVSACSKGACAGDRHAAGWRGVAAQQPANLPSHRAEFNLFVYDGE